MTKTIINIFSEIHWFYYQQNQTFYHFPKQNDKEIHVYEAILDAFYLLELGQNEAITVYAKHSYNKITDDGPTYYTVKKKYFLYKNKIPYFQDQKHSKRIC